MVHHGISLLGTLFFRAIPTVYIGILRILDPLLHIYIMMTSNCVLLNNEEKTDKTIVQVYMLLPTVCLIISHVMVQVISLAHILAEMQVLLLSNIRGARAWSRRLVAELMIWSKHIAC